MKEGQSARSLCNFTECILGGGQGSEPGCIDFVPRLSPQKQSKKNNKKINKKKLGKEELGDETSEPGTYISTHPESFKFDHYPFCVG